MEIAFWLIIIFTLVYEPIIGYWSYKKFSVEVKQNQHVRTKYYKNIMLWLWIPTIFIFLLVFFTDLTFENIGLTVPSINTDTLGKWATYSVFAAALLYLISILYYSIGYHVSDKVKAKLIEANQKASEHIRFEELLPVTKKEKKLWNYVSLTAGITEEMIYRGFLIYAIAYLFPNFSIWLVLLVSSFLFGLAHAYQGFKTGVLRTTIVGFIFSILYIGLGSIFPVMLLHFLIDYLAKLGDTKQMSVK